MMAPEPFPEPKPEAPAPPKLTKPPKMVQAAEPVYPPDALAARISADVTLTVDLDATGVVTGAMVEKPVGQGFDESAIAAVRASKFSPAEVDGKPSAIRFQYTLHFVPKVVEVTPPPAVEPEPPPPPPPPPPQPVVATGRVREKGTRNPLGQADVAVSVRAPSGTTESARVVATTDEDGRFELRGEPGQPLRVIIGDGTHEPCIRDINGAALRADKPVEIDCLVPRRGGPSYETRVSAPRETQSATRYTLSQPELTTVPGTFGDPLRVVQNLPGVARTPFGLGLLVIRGSSPDDSAVFVEGHQIPILYHFLAGPSVISPRLIDRVDFFPGNFGVQYGRFSGGIIDVGVKTEPTKRLHGDIDLNFLHSGAYIEGPVGGGWTGRIGARRSYYDLWLPLVLPTSTISIAPVYWDYQAGVNRELAGGRLSLFAFGSNDSFEVISKNNADGNFSIDTATGFHRVLAVWAKNIGNWVNKLSPALGYDRFVFKAGPLAINQASYLGEVRNELTRVFSPKLTFRVGFDGQARRDKVFFDLPIEPEARLYGPTKPQFEQRTIPLDRQSAGLFTDAIWDLGGGVRLIPGLRVDYHHYVGQNRWTFDPRLIVRWKTSARQVWKAGAGVFHQMPYVQLLNPEFGNPALPPIIAGQYSAGFERRLTDKLTIDTTVYLVQRYDIPVPVAGMPPFEASGKNRSYGLELILKHDFTERFYGWLAYTLSKSEENATGVGGVSTADPNALGDPNAAKSTWTPTAFDQTHNLILIGSYRWKAWRFGGRFRLVTGSPTTRMQEGSFDADQSRYVCRQSPPNSGREDTFHQLDTRIERKWTFNAWEMSVYADVQNIYNATNREATFYDYRCRGSTPVRGIPLLPILGIEGIF